MSFGIFKKYCPVCGQDVKRGEALKRFGKYYCSEAHAEEDRKKMEEQKSKSAKSGGGCC